MYANLWSLPQENAHEVLPHGIQEFTLVEIMAATNNFGSDTIGDGGFGKVYREPFKMDERWP